jgi:hypothetical protein
MEHDHIATDSEAVQEYAVNAGQDNPERAWLLTSYDTWVRNPFYRGSAVPHPEEQCDTEGETA